METVSCGTTIKSGSVGMEGSGGDKSLAIESSEIDGVDTWMLGRGRKDEKFLFANDKSVVVVVVKSNS